MHAGRGIKCVPFFSDFLTNITHDCISIDPVADDLWLLPVSGCVSLRVHTVTPQSAAGTHQAADTAVLRTQVTHTHTPESDQMPPELPRKCVTFYRSQFCTAFNIQIIL